MKKRRYPVGQQDFGGVIKDGCVYVDKTEYIHNMIEEGKYYFFSRPRRFGKSLTVSTLQYLFEGERELFKGLYIEDKWNWEKKTPVIWLDFNLITTGVVTLPEAINRYLDELAHNHGITYSTEDDYAQKFKELIVTLGSKDPVAILIDEYDKPIIDYIASDKEKAIAHRKVLKALYTCIKPCDKYIRFFFITGVTKFSQVSIFSSLNNLADLTMHDDYAAMCGITQTELETNFREELEAFAQKENRSYESLLDKLKFWYNGFRFSQNPEKVYNPYSMLQVLRDYKFQLYWFVTGTPTFLVDLIRENQIDVREISDQTMDEAELGNFQLENIPVITLLFQTGYLTVSDYTTDFGETVYTLSYPNFEVETGFTKSLLEVFTKEEKTTNSYINKLKIALHQNDIEGFMKALKSLLSGVVYGSASSHESHYEGLFYLVFKLLGTRINPEERTNKGRIDAVAETSTHIYLFELKLNQPAAKAIEQIENMAYFEKYLSEEKQVVCLGVSISSEERNVNEWERFLIRN